MIRREWFSGPDALVESNCASVQRIRSVILIEVVHHVSQSESRSADAICVPTDQGSEVRPRVRKVTVERIETQDDIVPAVIAIRCLQRDESAAVGADSRRQAAGVF